MSESTPKPMFAQIAEYWRSNPDPVKKAASYDDFIIRPGYSDLRTVDETSTRTTLIRDIDIEVPITTANMNTVTESTMAIFIANEGGFGFIHRFLTIDEEVAQVKKVKGATNYVVADPPKVSSTDTVEKAKQIMEAYQRGFVAVYDNDEFVGLASTRDLGDMAPDDAPLSHIMTPRDKLYVARPGISMENAKDLCMNIG